MKNICGYLITFLSLIALGVQAQSFCFASASSYYEQIYCELQAKGEAKSLPPLYQFKRNDPMTQALLLKRPAKRINIEVPMPSRKPPPALQSMVEQSDSSGGDDTLKESGRAGIIPAAAPQVLDNTDQSGCTLVGSQIHCGKKHFQLTGNRRNQRLGSDALTPANQMALPIFHGDIKNLKQVNTYLTRSYRRYIERMQAVGLGGVTMTYEKFYFLFFDLQDKGLDFSQRFETMYKFLKQDKLAMSVSETVKADPMLTIKDCDRLSDSMMICSHAGRNYLYPAVSE